MAPSSDGGAPAAPRAVLASKAPKHWRHGKPRDQTGRKSGWKKNRDLTPPIDIGSGRVSVGAHLTLKIDLRRKEFRELLARGYYRDRFGRLYNKAAGEKPTGPKVWNIRYKQVWPSRAKFTPEERKRRLQTQFVALQAAGKAPRSKPQVQGASHRLAISMPMSMSVDINNLSRELGIVWQGKLNPSEFCRRAIACYIEALKKQGIGGRVRTDTSSHQKG